MKINYLLITSFLLMSIFSFAQKVSVSKITERRSTGKDIFDNKCEVELKVWRDDLRKYQFVKISKILKVTDDQELDLLSEEDKDYDYEKIDKDAILKFETKIPARKASVLREISGELILFNPTTANGSIIKIANYQSKTNVNLLPASSDLQLVYLTKESMEKLSAEQNAKKEEELKKLPEATRKLAEGLISIFDSFSFMGNSPNEVSFYVSGDQSKLADLYFEDAKGKQIERNGRSRMNNLISYSFEEKPKPDWKLVLVVETPKSVKKLPFKLENIDLP